MLSVCGLAYVEYVCIERALSGYALACVIVYVTCCVYALSV